MPDNFLRISHHGQYAQGQIDKEFIITIKIKEVPSLLKIIINTACGSKFTLSDQGYVPHPTLPSPSTLIKEELLYV